MLLRRTSEIRARGDNPNKSTSRKTKTTCDLCVIPICNFVGPPYRVDLSTRSSIMNPKSPWSVDTRITRGPATSYSRRRIKYSSLFDDWGIILKHLRVVADTRVRCTLKFNDNKKSSAQLITTTQNFNFPVPRVRWGSFKFKFEKFKIWYIPLQKIEPRAGSGRRRRERLISEFNMREIGTYKTPAPCQRTLTPCGLGFEGRDEPGRKIPSTRATLDLFSKVPRVILIPTDTHAQKKKSFFSLLYTTTRIPLCPYLLTHPPHHSRAICTPVSRRALEKVSANRLHAARPSSVVVGRKYACVCVVCVCV